jgi:hypothetical protein
MVWHLSGIEKHSTRSSVHGGRVNGRFLIIYQGMLSGVEKAYTARSTGMVDRLLLLAFHGACNAAAGVELPVGAWCEPIQTHGASP